MIKSYLSVRQLLSTLIHISLVPNHSLNDWTTSIFNGKSVLQFLFFKMYFCKNAIIFYFIVNIAYSLCQNIDVNTIQNGIGNSAATSVSSIGVVPPGRYRVARFKNWSMKIFLSFLILKLTG